MANTMILRSTDAASRLRALGLPEAGALVVQIRDALDALGERHPRTVVLQLTADGVTLESRFELVRHLEANAVRRLARRLRRESPRVGHVHALVLAEDHALLELPLDTFRRTPDLNP